MLAVARALARRPKLLLLDELSLGLAPVIVERLLPVVRAFAHERGCAVLLVEQHVHLALEVADRGYVLSHGEIVLHNDAEQLRADRQLLIASYLGEHAQARRAIEAGAEKRRTREPIGAWKTCSATVGSPVELLRNSQAGPNVYPGVPAEFTNWRDEQTAWQQTCVLFNQSYHMADLAVEGPDALEAALRPRRQQLRRVRGRPGEALRAVHARRLRDRRRDPVRARREPVQPRRPRAGAELGHATTPRPAATTSRSSSTSGRALRTDGRRKSYRFQVQGPNAMDVIEKVLGGAAAGAEVLQHDRRSTIAGQDGPRAAPRHGRPAGLGAVRARGTTARRCARRSSTAGEEFGLRQVGGRAYSSNTLESGWIPSPLPAVYSGESLKPYREWLPANGLRGLGVDRRQLLLGPTSRTTTSRPGTSATGSYVKFDHDFIGREALEQMADDEHRQKVTLALDDDDVTRTIGTMFGKADRAKFIDWPSAVYSMHPFDRVTVDGETVGRLHLGRLQRERGQDAHAGGRRARVRGARAPR